MRSRTSLAGFSILEFMISITLGALLVAAVGMTYVSNRNVNTIQEGLSRLQENARYVSYILAREIRMAGYSGCANQRNIGISNLAQNNPNLTDFSRPLQGYDGSGGTFSPALPAHLVGQSIVNSDILELRMGSNTSVQLRDNMNQTNNPVQVYDRLNLQAGEPVLITNCTVGDVFIAGANANAAVIVHTMANNTSNDLSIPYTSDAQVMRFLYFAYYVKDTGRTNALGNPIQALVRRNFNGTEEEIADGVEMMRIRYGVDTNADNNVDEYMNATQVNSSNNWNNVLSAEIRLLMATTEQLNEKPMAYTFDSATVTPNDRRLYREWKVYITLRNRGMPT